MPATNTGHDGEVEKLVRVLRTQLHALKKERAAQDARYVALATKHQEDKELHEASLDQLRQHMAHMNDSLALLREDRELLNRDVLVEREANKKLTEENDQLKIHQGELSRHHKELEDQLATMAASELTARNFAANTRSIEDAQTDATFRQRFNLPATEFPIISYYCCHKHIYHGWLYITPAYVCFEPALLSKESSRITTPLTSITTLAKVRGFKYIPGTDNALTFKLKSGVEYFFNNFTHRDSVIANVVHQAAKFGHRIQSQDEKQIPDEGKEPKRPSDGVEPPAGSGSLGQSKDTDSLPRPSSSSFDHSNVVPLPRVSHQRPTAISHYVCTFIHSIFRRRR